MRAKWLMAGKTLLMMLAVLLLGGCGSDGKAVQGQAGLIVYSSHPQRFVQPLVDEFERQTGITVRIVAGSTGELLERVAQEKPVRADVFWGGAISKVEARQELFEQYVSSQDEALPPSFRNGEGRLTRFTDVPSVLLVNTRLLGAREITGYGDLLDPGLKGKIAFADPAVSSSAYAHLLNMLAEMGRGDAEAGWEYMQAFCANLDGRLLPDSQAVCNGVAQGRFAVGCTFEEPARLALAEGKPVRLVYMQEGVHSVPDGVYIVKDTVHREAAQAFVEFLVSREAQQYIVQHLYRRSVRQDVAAPDGQPLLPPLTSGSAAVGAGAQADILARFSRCLGKAGQ